MYKIPGISCKYLTNTSILLQLQLFSPTEFLDYHEIINKTRNHPNIAHDHEVIQFRLNTLFLLFNRLDRFSQISFWYTLNFTLILTDGIDIALFVQFNGTSYTHDARGLIFTLNVQKLNYRSTFHSAISHVYSSHACSKPIPLTPQPSQCVTTAIPQQTPLLHVRVPRGSAITRQLKLRKKTHAYLVYFCHNAKRYVFLLEHNNVSKYNGPVYCLNKHLRKSEMTKTIKILHFLYHLYFYLYFYLNYKQYCLLLSSNEKLLWLIWLIWLITPVVKKSKLH